MAVIGYCNLIRSACAEKETGGSSSEVNRQIAVFKTFEQVREGLTGQGGPLVTYADKSVWEPLEELTDIVQSARWDDFAWLIRDLANYRKDKESAIDDQDFALAAELRGKEKATQEKMAKGSTLDVEALHKLVVSIIDALRVRVS